MTIVTKEDFIDMVIELSMLPCDSRIFPNLTDMQNKILASAASATEDVDIQDMNDDSCIGQCYYKYIKITYSSREMILDIEGKPVHGVMFGNDEMFRGAYFCQYFVDTNGILYRVMYDADRPDVNTGDLADVDYDRFDRIEIED